MAGLPEEGNNRVKSLIHIFLALALKWKWVYILLGLCLLYR